MALSSEQFLNQVVASELLAQEDVSAFLSAIPVDRRPKDGEQLARELVRQKKLTKYQAEQIYSGKGKTLILGNYVVLDKLGQGGMGVVLKAEHKRLKRLVALKVMSSNLVKTPDALKRFHREVEAAAKLRHTNVVATDDADEAKGTHFLVMEYVEGSDLSALVKKNGPLSVSQAVQCILQAARGLEYAHKQGVVHRDIKPANLLLDTTGTVKILDMGLARIEGDSGSQGELTSTGAVMGTVDYMAPEQAMSTKHADARSDIYSLGISLWYLLAGRCAYEGDSLMAKLLAHRDAAIPSLCAVDSGIPAALDAVFRKMVAKQAKDRYQSMTEVIRDLESCQEGSGSVPGVASPNNFEDPSLQSFLSQLGGTPSSSAASTASRKSSDPATRVKINPAAEATMLNGNIGVDTDPQTMTSIRKQERQARRGNRVTEVQAASPPWYLDKRILLGGGVLAALLLVAVVILMRTPNGTLRVEILDPKVEMKVKGTELTFQANDVEPVSLVAGDKNLIVTRGDLTFETETFTLKKGTETRIKVELIGDKVVVNRDGDLLAERALGRTLITSSTTMNPIETPKLQIGSGTAGGFFAGGTQRAQPHAALQFDGSSAALVEIESLRIPRGGPLTIEGYFTPTKDEVREINQVLGCPYNRIFINQQTQDWSFVWQQGNGTRTTCVGTRFVKGQRTHVAGVVADESLRLFINGKSVATQPLNRKGGQSGLQELSGITLGSAFHGLIDNVRVSKTARYLQDFTPPARLVPDEESLLCFDFSEGKGERLQDSSGNRHHGQIVAATWVPPDASRSMLDFSGENTRVEITTLPFDGKSDFTVEAWAIPRTTGKTSSDTGAMIGWGGGVSTELGQLGASWSFATLLENGTLPGVLDGNVIPFQRTHVAGVRKGNEFRLYVNGKSTFVAGDFGGRSVDPKIPPIFWIGNNPQIDHPYDGWIDTVRLSNKARYDQEFVPANKLENDEATIALYQFEEGTGDRLRDSSGNNHHGKILGAKWVKPVELLPATSGTGNSIELLTLIDVPRDAGVGNWKRTPEGITCENPDGANVLQLPYEPPEEYDFDIEFTATGNGLNVNQYIAAEGQMFAWKLNSHGVNPPLYGFELLDGKFAKDNKEAAVQIPEPIRIGQRYRSTVQVRRGSLRTLLDGKELVNWSGDFKRFSTETVTPMKYPGRIGIGSWRRPVTFHSVTIREISGTGKITGGSSKTTVASGWEDWLGPALDRGVFKRAGRTREKDGVTTDLAITGEEVLPGETRNGAIRATYLLRSSRGIQLSARTRNSQVAREFNYFAEDNGDKIQIATMVNETEYHLLGELDVPTSIPKDAPRTLEFRVVDNVLTLTLNNSLVLTVRDKTQADGFFAVAALKGLLIQKVEIQRFDNLSPSQGNGNTWQSLFNGKDLSGWKVIGVDGWTVKSGILTGKTSQQNGNGWLMSEAEFSDYELELEYKLSTGSNSGLFPRALPTGDVSGKDFVEIQLLDDNDPGFVSVPADRKTGSIFGRFAPQPTPMVPPNQWHRVKMVVRGQNVSLEINDVVVVKQGLPDLPLKGHIGLQLYPTQVEFRNLRIRP